MSKMKSMPNFYALHLQRIGRALVFVDPARALEPLGTAIRRSGRRVNAAVDANDRAYSDAVCDDESELVELLLGTAFVVCQAYIASLVSRVRGLHQLHRRLAGSDLTTTDGTKLGLLRLGSPKVEATDYTQIEVIDAFANYFKHGDEWPVDWSRVRRNAQRAVRIITAVGARSGSTGNFRQAAAALGNGKYENVDVFSDALEAWRGSVYEAYESELRSTGLLGRRRSSPPS